MIDTRRETDLRNLERRIVRYVRRRRTRQLIRRSAWIGMLLIITGLLVSMCLPSAL